MNLPSIQYLREMFEVREGRLYWVERPEHHFEDPARWLGFNRRFAGKEAGFDKGDGYRQACIGGRNFKAHRVVWALTHGEWPVGFIDHINGIRDDNRPANLRVVTPAENGLNRKVARHNRSGFHGVSWESRTQRWRVSGCVAGRQMNLGTFDTIEEAVERRKQWDAERGFTIRPLNAPIRTRQNEGSN